MSYIGNQVISTDFPKDTFSGNGSTTAFTMSIAPASVNAVIVVVSGITQDPSTYTISGTTLTFSAAPPTGTSNISVRHLGVAGIPNVPADASVTSAKLASGNLFSQWATSGSDINYTAGNVGIGTASPTGKLNVQVAYVSDTTTQMRISDTTGTSLDFGGTGGGVKWLNARDTGSGAAYPLAFQTGGTERMRIESGGNVLIGCTTVPTTAASTAYGVGFQKGISQAAVTTVTFRSDTSNATEFSYFYNTNGLVGYIRLSGSSTTYSTSSDYRLKENVLPMTGALEKVSMLKPCTYTWKVDGTEGQGFIAHELQEVCPDAVCGEKDAVDADGNIKPQGIDTSFLVATLTAAIQEQQAIIEELKTRVTALETV